MLMVITYAVASFILLDQTLTKGQVGGQEDRPTSLNAQRDRIYASKHLRTGQSIGVGLLTRQDYIGVIVLILLEVYCTVLHPYLLPTFPFWPLLLTSTSLSLGLLWVWSDLWRL